MKKVVLIIILVFAVVLVVSVVLFMTRPLTCERRYDALDRELKESNYCRVDADCAVLPLGGEYIAFGCYHYVNKEVNQEDLMEKIDAFTKSCAQMIDDCAFAPLPACVAGTCVEKKE